MILLVRINTSNGVDSWERACVVNVPLLPDGAFKSAIEEAFTGNGVASLAKGAYADVLLDGPAIVDSFPVVVDGEVLLEVDSDLI